MINISKTMPNGAICALHRTHSYVQHDSGVYTVSVASYTTDRVYGPVSWQQDYIAVPTSEISNIQDIEKTLVNMPESPFFGGIVK